MRSFQRSVVSKNLAFLVGEAGPEPSAFVTEFSRVVSMYKDEIAVAGSDGRMTYKELDAVSNRIAEKLSQVGALQGQGVGVWLAESCHLVATAVAIFKLQAIYVPLDRSLPVNRVSEMIIDGGVHIAVTDHETSFGLPCRLVGLRTLLEANDCATPPHTVPRSDGSRICYQTYTSGSSGRPKVIKISEDSMMSYIACVRKRYGIKQQSSIITTASISFDASVREIFCSLLTGSTLYVPHRGIGFDAATYINLLVENKISTILSMTPSILKVISAAALHGRIPAITNLDLLCVGGEVLDARTAEAAQRLFPAALIINHYGPSECTMTSTAWRLPKIDGSLERLAVGTPNWDTYALIIDEFSKRICEVGQEGEIWIFGRRVSREYAVPENELSAVQAENFPDWPGYKTGDLGFVSSDGELFVVGRLDDQIKLRGIRVDPRDLTERILAIEGIADAVTVSSMDDKLGYQLHSYVVLSEECCLAGAEIKATLRDHVPSYLVPATITLLPNLPVNNHGKLDRKALPHPVRTTHRSQHSATSLESELCNTFSEILGVDEVTPDESFFDLGGHSLLATYLVLAVNEAQGSSLPLEEIFSSPTPRLLAKAIKGSPE
nr:non-ribosomal peptide synthetase [Agrobacterium tumefaciens]